MARRLYSIRSAGAYLAKRDGGWNCHYCGCAIHREPMRVNSIKKPRQATVDHMHPLSKGGSDSVQNMVLACSVCNNEKADMDYFAFWQVIYARQAEEQGAI
jgi:CRISPR/Cas system Type II protein with McrA/HNH and RuvC-like nuclease domain